LFLIKPIYLKFFNYIIIHKRFYYIIQRITYYIKSLGYAHIAQIISVDKKKNYTYIKMNLQKKDNILNKILLKVNEI